MLCPGWWLVQANQTGWNTVGLKSTLVHSAIIFYYWIHKSTTTWHLKLLHNRFLYMCFVGRTLLVIETFVFFSHTNPMLFFFSEPNSINNFVRLSSSLIGAAKAMKPNTMLFQNNNSKPNFEDLKCVWLPAELKHINKQRKRN